MNELATLVRKHDFERYICSLFAPAKARPHLWALQAIAYELLRIPSSVSEEMVGLIRLKWWQEEITKLYDTGVHTHPTLRIVAGLLATSPLKPEDYILLIDTLTEQIGEPYNSERILKTLQVYYELLAKTVNDNHHREFYGSIGNVQASIALVRSYAKQQKEEQLQQLLKQELMQSPLPKSASRYLRALYTLNRCWLVRIKAFRTHGSPALTQPLSSPALRLASGVILGHR